MELDDGLLEWDYGDYDGLTTAEIREERPDWYLWRDGCPNGESPDEVAERIDPVVERARAAEGSVALFAHGHVLRAARRPLDRAAGRHGRPSRPLHRRRLRARVRARSAHHSALERCRVTGDHKEEPA